MDYRTMIPRSMGQPANIQGKVSGINNQIASAGGYPSELRSVWKLKAGDAAYSFFAGAESQAGISHLARYNVGGKNPLQTSSGKLMAFSMSFHGPDYAAPVWTPALVSSVEKLFNQLIYVVKQNTRTLKDGLAVSLLTSTIPVLVGGVDPAVPVSAIYANNGPIDGKGSKIGTHLTINFSNASETFEFLAELPKDQAGFRVPANLVDHIVVLHAFAAEKPQSAKVG